MPYQPARKPNSSPVCSFLLRYVTNLGWPKPATSGISEAVDDEAEIAFAKIKCTVEPWI